MLLTGLLAVMAMAAPAKTADELRIYINPGHGSWTANDRPMPIIGHEKHSRFNTDTLSFFESNTNLRKGFGVLEKLRAMGLQFDPTLNQEGERYQIGAARDLENNIVMSHVKCGPYHDYLPTAAQAKDDKRERPADSDFYNRSLPEICVEVEDGDFDMFISIHSNAVDSSGWKVTNFPIVLYRGFDNVDTEHVGIDVEHQRLCKQMGQAIWPYHMANTHECWTAYSTTNMNVRGDCNFYAGPSVGALGYYGYLGVLKHGVPGFLVEGYFHQYAPAALRHMNWDVDYIEGYNYAHGIADIFGLTKEKTGDIYGIVRDRNEKFENPDYVAKPGSDDMYKPLNGAKAILKQGDKVIAEYVTDHQYNGAFVFKDVEPGSYTLEFEAEGYLPIDEPVEVTVEAATVSYPKAFLTSESFVPPTVFYYNYPDELAGTSFGARSDYAFTSTKASVAELEGKTVRRMIVHSGDIYVLAYDAEQAAHIYVIDGSTMTVKATPSTEGTEGTERAVADIQVTADGVLIACNEELCQYSNDQVDPGKTRGDCNIYRWTNNKKGMPEGKPELWLTTQLSGNMYRALSGGSMFYTGTTDEGSVYLTAENASSGAEKKFFFSTLSVIGGKKASEEIRNNGDICVDYFTMDIIGKDLTLTVSPLNDMSFIANSPKVGARQYCIGSGNKGTVLEAEMPAGLIPNESAQASFFKYSGHSYMAAPAVDENGASTGVVLLDITNGLDKAEVVETYNTSVEAVPGVYAAGGFAQVSRNEMDKITNAAMVLYLLRGNEIVRFTTEGVKQHQPRREYAYNVKMEKGDDAYTVTFDATGAAPEATVVFTPENGEALRFPVGAVSTTDNSVTIDASNFDEDGYYTWGVEVVSNPIATAGEVSSDPSGLTVRGGVITITDPNEASFGYVAVGHGANKGIDIYNPAGEKVATRLFVNHAQFGGATTNQSNPFRGNQYKGKAIFSTWGDAGYGVVSVNPLDATEEPATFFAGNKQSTGHFMYNGVNLGGGNAGFDFITVDDETYLISFSEDHEGLNGKGATENTIVKQHLSSPWQITEAPVSLGYKAFLANTNVDIQAYGKGVFVSQVRGSGNNIAGCPSFAYIADITGDHGTALTSADTGIGAYVDDNTSGIAISADGKLFAASLKASIVVFDVTWNEYGEPSMTYRLDFPVEEHTWAHMHFDAANNLHVYLRESGYHVYSLPGEAPVSFTSANKDLFLGKAGVTDITVDEARTADAVFYNLQGVKVPSTNLNSGIYIMVRGREASKVFVK